MLFFTAGAFQQVAGVVMSVDLGSTRLLHDVGCRASLVAGQADPVPAGSLLVADCIPDLHAEMNFAAFIL